MKLKTLAVKAPLVLAVSIVAAASPAPFAAPRPPDIPFRIQMLDGGASETAAVADINKDGRPDIVSGEHWYQGQHPGRGAGTPAWTKHKFRELDFSNNYIDGFSDHAGRRRRRRLSRHRQRHLVCEEDLLVQEPRQGRGRLGRGADQRRLQHRVRDACRHEQRRQGERDRRAGERHRSVVVRGQEASKARPGGGSSTWSATAATATASATATSTRMAATTS